MRYTDCGEDLFSVHVASHGDDLSPFTWPRPRRSRTYGADGLSWHRRSGAKLQPCREIPQDLSIVSLFGLFLGGVQKPDDGAGSGSGSGSGLALAVSAHVFTHAVQARADQSRYVPKVASNVAPSPLLLLTRFLHPFRPSQRPRWRSFRSPRRRRGRSRVQKEARSFRRAPVPRVLP